MMQIKCYNNQYSTMGYTGERYQEFTTEKEYLESIEEEESFSSMLHKAIDELSENVANKIVGD